MARRKDLSPLERFVSTDATGADLSGSSIKRAQAVAAIAEAFMASDGQHRDALLRLLVRQVPRYMVKVVGWSPASIEAEIMPRLNAQLRNP